MYISHTHILYLIFKSIFITRKIKELELKCFILDARGAKRLEKQQRAADAPRRAPLGEPDVSPGEPP